MVAGSTEKAIIKVGLIGNPNVGKSVIFNNLTGSKQHIGNWPGKTVEKKEGHCIYKGEKVYCEYKGKKVKDVDLNIVDLPGTYSLTARSIDELIARDFIIEEKPDVIVHIVDASNLERNLYLTLLLLEFEASVVIALNMIDIAKDKGYAIDVEKLSKLLGIPVIPTVAPKKKGMTELVEAIVQAYNESQKRSKKPPKMKFSKSIDKKLKQVMEVVKRDSQLPKKYPLRWLAIRLLEHDEEVLKKIEDSPHKKEIMEALI